jgi:hypothetical protein
MDTQHVKFLMTWDVRPGKKNLIGVHHTGILRSACKVEPATPDAWYTV